MKNITLSLAVAVLVYACNEGSGQGQQAEESSQNAVINFIPGMYVRSFYDSIYETTNVRGVDTLRIKRQTETGSETFQVDRSKRFTRTADGKTLPESFSTETWTTSYQPSDKTLYIKNTGGTIAFDVKNKLLKIGAKEYQKIE
ncbi:hypothetical protein [Longitalea luteola]|uniref:hypothetical protein n=1 Tax=Longitalea luteola TaxID=2812563 RepID=UPI001A96AC21|nr:hypothetical protein [Longitalea luteola]